MPSKKKPRPEIRGFRWALDKAEFDKDGKPAPRPDLFKGTIGQKRNYAQRLSDNIAIIVADALRSKFRNIKPDAEGEGRESRARTSKGFKRLDVNYSTLELGLGLGVSIKTINYPTLKKNKKTGQVTVGRYTKNYTRADNELRAEAQDYHLRQPYSVMIAIIFIPRDACDRQEEVKVREGALSSFAQAVRIFRHRGGRQGPKDVEELFERVFLGVYEHEGANRGAVWFFDVRDTPRRMGPPRKQRTFEQLIAHITQTYDALNNPPFEWDTNGNGGNGGSSGPSE